MCGLSRTCPDTELRLVVTLEVLAQLHLSHSESQTVLLLPLAGGRGSDGAARLGLSDAPAPNSLLRLSQVWLCAHKK